MIKMFKKITSTFSFVSFLFSLFSFSVNNRISNECFTINCSDVCSNVISDALVHFEIISDDEVKINYCERGLKATSPKFVDFVEYNLKSYKISEINDNAFNNYDNPNSFNIDGELTVPKYLKRIGKRAFANCGFNNLRLDQCEKLEIIDSGAFYRCLNLTNSDNQPLVFPSTLIKIDGDKEDGAFEDCTSLSSIDFSNSLSLQEIGDYAFSGCSKINSNLHFQQSLTSIGNFSFAFCSNLSCVDFHSSSSLKTINSYAFFQDHNLEIENFVNAASLNFLGDNAFSCCDSIDTFLEFPSSINYIGHNCFYESTILETLKLNWDPDRDLDSVKMYSDSLPLMSASGKIQITKDKKKYLDFFSKFGYSFDWDQLFITSFITKLSELVEGKIEGVDPDVNCSVYGTNDEISIDSIETLSNFKITNMSFKDFYFYEGSQVEKYKICKISPYCFNGNKSVFGSLKFNKYIEEIGSHCFQGCENINTLDFSENTSLKMIDSFSFADCKNLSNTLSIPKSTRTFGISCFRDAGSFESLIFNWNVEDLEGVSVENEDSLPSLIDNIHQRIYAKIGTPNLILKMLQTHDIEKYSLNQFATHQVINLSLSLVSQYENMTNQDNIVACTFDDFFGEVSIDNLLINSLIKNIKFNDFFYYNNNKYKIIKIGEKCFADKTLKGDVYIPNTISSIGAEAFFDTDIESVSIEENSVLYSIGDSAFKNCFYLRSFQFKNTKLLNSIGDFAFESCQNLDSEIYIPGSTVQFGRDIFLNSRKMNIISFNWSSDYLNNKIITFTNINSLPNVYYSDTMTPKILVPLSLKKEYQNFFKKTIFSSKYYLNWIDDGSVPIPVPDDQNSSNKMLFFIVSCLSIFLSIIFIICILIYIMRICKKTKKC